MADPGTMALVGMGTNVAGNLLGIGKASSQAQAQRLSIQGQMMKTMADAFGMEVQAEQYTYEANKNKYQAAVADMNEEIAKGNSAYAKDVGEVEAEQAGLKAHAELGEMVASQGASGLNVNVGSAVKVRESMIEVGDWTQKIVRASAAKKAYGYDVEAMQYGAQADIYRYTATQNEAQATESLKGAAFARKGLGLQQQAMGLVDKAEGINIMGSLVGAAGSVADKWSSATSSGLGASMVSGIKGMFG
jgi:hypothetical protein